MSDAVVNSPAGGDQAFASTNDHNANDVLHARPWTVVANDGEAIGVVDRFAEQGDATANAEGRTKTLRDAGNTKTIFEVVKENDPDNGLPNMLANVQEAAETPPAATPAAAHKSTRSRASKEDS